MEPHRPKHPMSGRPIKGTVALGRGGAMSPLGRPCPGSSRLGSIGTQRSQAGITAIGFLILAALCGVVGFAGLKLVPMYLKNMRLATVLEDVRAELDVTNTTAGQIRSAINKRFDVEGIRLPPDSVKINQARNGYQVSIQYDNRASYIADIWLLVTFDKQIEIRR